jgi:hypothetical protein
MEFHQKVEEFILFEGGEVREKFVPQKCMNCILMSVLK